MNRVCNRAKSIKELSDLIDAFKEQLYQSYFVKKDSNMELYDNLIESSETIVL